MATTRKMGAREVALEIIQRVEEHKSYSNLELKRVLDKTPLRSLDVGLVTELVYGTIQRRNTLDYILDQFIKGKKVQPWVRNLLRLSMYQIRFLDRVPARAAVHEAVEIAKGKGHQGIASMVNGVLRNVLRQPEVWDKLPEGKPVIQIALAESHPEWLVQRWVKSYGEETTRAICQSNNRPPHTSVRVNPLKTSRDQLLERVQQEYPDVIASSVSPDGIIFTGGYAAGTSWFREGFCTVQDESSMLVAPALAVKSGQRVLDACAAPGGKTTHLAERMNDEGEIIACDVHPHKQDLIVQTAVRLGITIVKTIVSDALELSDKSLGQFDRILLDAPCTGFGVIRRKPDLKWNKTEQDIHQIAELQYRLLEQVSMLLAPGGLLVYSTCTIEPEENQQIVERFVGKNPEFELDQSLIDDLPEFVTKQIDCTKGYVQILPHHFQSDGFFISRLRRKS